MDVEIRFTKEIPKDQLLEIYRLNNWSSAEKPELLYKALTNSHTLVSAWVNGRLVGIANAISDGFLVVYYPHMLVHPDYQKHGIGKQIMDAIQEIYHGFHQQMLTSDAESI